MGILGDALVSVGFRCKSMLITLISQGNILGLILSVLTHRKKKCLLGIDINNNWCPTFCITQLSTCCVVGEFPIVALNFFPTYRNLAVFTW